MKSIFKSVKFRLPATIVGGISVVSFLMIFLSYQDSVNVLNDRIENKFQTFKNIFTEQLKTEENSLKMSMSVLLNNENVIQLFAEQNRDEMTKFLSPLFNKVLKKEYDIAQFQFHNPPATSFLRLHKPGKFGDDLSSFRETVVETNLKQKIVSGIEVGRGGPGLRIVFPVKFEGKHIGSVEFGGNINNIFKGITKALKLEYAVGIKRNVFQKARRFDTKDTDIINNDIVFYQYSNNNFVSILKNISLNGKIEKFDIEDNNFAVASVSLFDFANRQIGYITLLDNITEDVENVYSSLWNQIIIILLVSLIIGGFGFYISVHSISNPLSKISDSMMEIAKGDLSASVSINSGDEFELLNNSILLFLNNFREIIKRMKTTEETLLSSSTQLIDASSNVSSGIAEVSSELTTVASSTEHMSTNITSMSATAEEMSINAQNVASSSAEMSETISSVAAAVEEMSMSISDVLKNSNESSTIAGEAAVMSSKATKTMKMLGSAANEIGKVTEVIKRIAEQTNLLALNATIEAASAGEAGKGFAVVANEIKELANQSATAAEDIASKITSVQENTTNAITVIDSVSSIIEKLNTSSEIIKISVEQQTQAVNSIATVTSESQTATENITRNIAEVADGSSDLAKNASESAEGANEVSRSVQSVDNTTATISNATEKFNSSAVELVKIAEELKIMIEQFKI